MYLRGIVDEDRLEDRSWDRAAVALAVVGLGCFVFFRARYVGACDQSSYYLESLRFRGIAEALELDSSVPMKGPLAPLCMETWRDEALVSFFPPGFPLLLALTGALGLEFHTTALLGAGAGLALYHLAKKRSNAAIALGVQAAWLCSPLVLFGSTAVMSDMPAAAFGVFAMLALDRGRSALAGALVGFSIGVRPTQALFVPVLYLLEPNHPRRTQLAKSAGLVASLVGWAVFQRVSLGAVALPYSDNLAGLTGAHFLRQAAFLAKEAALRHLPITLLAAVGLFRRPRATAPYALCLGAYTLFYALWDSPYEEWWWTRYVLPALPGLYLMAAYGAAEVFALKFLASNAARALALGLPLLAYAGVSLFTPPGKHLLSTAVDREYSKDAERAARLLPDGALVGAINDSGPLRYYGHLQSFNWCHPDTARLLRWATDAQRPLYAVLDDTERPCFVGDETAFELTSVEILATGKTLYRVSKPSGMIDVGAPEARSHLLSGWSTDERDGDRSFVWAIGHAAKVRLPNVMTTPGSDLRLRLFAAGFAPDAKQQALEVLAGGEPLGLYTLSSDYRELDVPLPARLAKEVLELRFTYATRPPADGNNQDPRELAAAFDWISLEQPTRRQ